MARLDAEALGELERRALDLQAVLAGGAVTAEIVARHRVFASVVKATGENLRILERAGGYGRESGGRG